MRRKVNDDFYRRSLSRRGAAAAKRGDDDEACVLAAECLLLAQKEGRDLPAWAVEHVVHDKWIARVEEGKRM